MSPCWLVWPSASRSPSAFELDASAASVQIAVSAGSRGRPVWLLRFVNCTGSLIWSEQFEGPPKIILLADGASLAAKGLSKCDSFNGQLARLKRINSNHD